MIMNSYNQRARGQINKRQNDTLQAKNFKPQRQRPEATR
ncbi:hypothetical protein BLL52_2075 [Rhodoferax antarcticus ANT.BR]|uniref:Uncharacterized protein n=1 Tax=Rhodoferax antarcticus ANT.BR TaxID=1111071 RepID=A0A1Q8YCU7_9BURK|nr:hypothetical protein BLL52_2075 [Rhodoferax antarcticus ANT.BR]